MQKTYPFTGSFLGQVWYRPKGTNQAWTKGNAFPVTITEDVGITDKISIDTGSFIPGQYRVNPYTVYERRHNWREPAISVCGTDATREYKLEVTGPSGLAALLSFVSPYVSILQNVDDNDKYVLQKAYSKLSKAQAGVGETLGELKETLRLLRDPFRSLRDFHERHGGSNINKLNELVNYLNSGGRMFRNGGRASTGRDAAKAAADTWLEYRYGVMPLYLLAQDLIEMAEKKVLGLDTNQIHTVRSRIVKKSALNLRPKEISWFSLGFLKAKATVDTSDELKLSAAVQYRVSGLPTLADRLGLTPRFLPELAWELTRLSFVVDWWFDVGTWLSSLRINPQIDVLGNTVGTKVVRTVSVSCDYSMGIFTPTKGQNEPGIGTFTYRYYNRVASAHLSPVPHWKPEYNSHLHLIDALALLIQPIISRLKRVSKTRH